MTIAILTDAAAALGTYALLRDAISSELDRDDLDGELDDFIRRAEFYLSDSIFHPLGETTSPITTTAGNERLLLPVGFRQMRVAHIVADPLEELQNVSPATLRDHWSTGSGQPQAYAIVNGQMILGPVPDAAYTISLTYLSDIVPLSEANASNWLLRRRADIYLYASLMYAGFHLRDLAYAAECKGYVDAEIEKLNQAGNRYRASASPYRLRSSVVV